MALTDQQKSLFTSIIDNIRAGAKICVMEVRDRESGKVLPCICGVSEREDGSKMVDFFPVAIMLMPGDADKFDPPIVGTENDFEGTH